MINSNARILEIVTKVNRVNTQSRQPKAKNPENIPDPVDIHVGRRIKIRRSMLKMSQEQLASLIGVTFQQIQKYESGANRVSSSRLYDIACALNQPISFFFEGIAKDNERLFKNQDIESNVAEEEGGFEDPMNSSMTLELINAFWRIKDEKSRQKAYELIMALASQN